MPHFFRGSLFGLLGAIVAVDPRPGREGMRRGKSDKRRRDGDCTDESHGESVPEKCEMTKRRKLGLPARRPQRELARAASMDKLSTWM